MTQPEEPQNMDHLAGSEYPCAAPVMVGITLVLFLCMIGLLYYRWLNMAEPNGFILIQGTKDFNGAEATVTDSGGDAESHGELKETNDYRMRFPLPQGTYRVTVMLNDKTIVKESVPLHEGTGMVFNLDNKLSATTEPASQ